MPQIKPYQDMTVEILQATENPAAQVGIALAITMKSDPNHIPNPMSETLGGNIIKCRHTSLFEHVHYTFLIQNVSRSFLAQITRQRTAHPTSGSQHYQNYEDYPLMVRDDMMGDLPRLALESSVSLYKDLVDDGYPKEEARQVLPNACAVNYLWTIDARNLMFFLMERCCNRNVTEMRIFAQRVLSLAKDHFPEVFNHVGPQCFMDQCEQHRLNMQCKEKTWKMLK